MVSSINYKQLALMCFGFFVVALLMPEMAMAGANNPLSKTLCNVVEWVTGTVGGAIASLAIIIIGIGALMGKVSWGMAIIVALGVGIIFGAETLVGLLAGGTGGEKCGQGV